MSTWTVPISWTVGQIVTAAQMNTETRDHLNFVKGSLDLISNSTTADTGNAMSLYIKRALATDAAYSAAVTADGTARLAMNAAGKISWGSGAAAADVTLERSAALNLKISSAGKTGLVIDSTLNSQAPFFTLQEGNNAATLTLVEPDRLQLTGIDNVELLSQAHLSFQERGGAPGGAADRAKLYAIDNGAGKTQLVVIFGTGAGIVLATQV